MHPTVRDAESIGDGARQRRVAMRVAYDGTDFVGWQRQPQGRTVQGVIESMLSRLAGDVHVPVVGAGRTDSGVHALAQVAHATIDTPAEDASLLRALQRMSPPDIAIDDLTTVANDFHARYTACRRSYRYTIIARGNPFRARYAWQIDTPLDLTVLREASASLLGTHDFTALSKHNPETPNPICSIESADWEVREDALTFDVTSDRFLYGMVRMLVGIQIDVARGRRPNDDIPATLRSRERALQSQAAPARGLALVGVGYPDGGPFAQRTR